MIAVGEVLLEIDDECRARYIVFLEEVIICPTELLDV